MYKMFKLLFCFLACVFVLNNTLALSDDEKTNIQQKLHEFVEKCIVEYPLSSDDVDYFKNQTFPDNENAGCFVACVFNKAGILDDKGKVSPTTAFEKARVFDDETELRNLKEFVSVCAIKVNDEDMSKCDRAKLTFNCLIENSEQFVFDIEL